VPGYALTGVILVLSIILLTGSSNAWVKAAHYEITRNTLEIIPKSLKEALVPHLDSLLYGSVEPDINRIDDHKIYLSSVGLAERPGSGGAKVALDRFARKAEDMLKAGEPMDKIAFVLGQAAHFIQDLNVPLHTVWGETRGQHDRYEREASSCNWDAEKHRYGGFYLIENYKCLADEIAKRSNQYVDLALSNPPPPQVIETTWRDAINDLANLWQSIFYRALGPEKALELYGIPAPEGEIGTGWFC
jgi:hypothetical protein